MDTLPGTSESDVTRKDAWAILDTLFGYWVAMSQLDERSERLNEIDWSDQGQVEKAITEEVVCVFQSATLYKKQKFHSALVFVLTDDDENLQKFFEYLDITLDGISHRDLLQSTLRLISQP